MIGTVLAAATLLACVVIVGEAYADFCEDPYLAAYPALAEVDCPDVGDPLVLTYTITEDDLDWSSRAPIWFDVSGRYKIDWGDGTGSCRLDNVTPGPRIGDFKIGRNCAVDSHVYTIPGTFTVTITGNLDYFRTGTQPASLEQWGDSRWKTMDRMFAEAGDMAYRATDEPDTSQVVSMANMFYGTAFNHDISSWDVSSVKDMSGMFRASTFNQPLNDWDVSGVTNMANMFYGAKSFNQPLDRWDVSSVTTMHNMFVGTQFNQDVSSWNVSGVTNMSGMFAGRTPFNQPLNNWNVSGVTSMAGMFAGTPFNQPLDEWDVSSVTNMYGMFSATNAFNQDISSWNTSSVDNMGAMFQHTNAFNQDISAWNVSSVTTMREMFKDADAFNQDISSWNVSGVTDMTGMFLRASSFNQPLDAWDVSGVTGAVPDHQWFTPTPDNGMARMFKDATSFNQPLGSWNTSSVTNMVEMFAGASSFNQPLNDWDVSNVNGMDRMFAGAKSFNQPLDGWDVSGLTSGSGMFDYTTFTQSLGSWHIHLDDLVVTDSDPVVGGISALSPALGVDGQRYSVIHPDDGTFLINPGKPHMLEAGLPYYQAGGHIPLYGATLVLNPDHDLKPGTYNVTIVRYTGYSNWHLGDFSPPYLGSDAYRDRATEQAAKQKAIAGFKANWRDGGTTSNWHGGTLSWPGSVNQTKTVEVLYDGWTLNRPPTAYATLIQTAQAGQVVTLNGTGSWDPDGNDLTYQWRQTGGANVTLVGDGTATPTFTAPDSDHWQTFKFELVVGDGRLESQPSNSTVLVTPN